MRKIKKVSRPSFLLLALLLMFSLSLCLGGCQPPTMGQGTGEGGEAEIDENKDYSMEEEASLESIDIGGGQIRVLYDHVDYGSSLTDLGLVEGLYPGLDLQSAGKDMFSFIVDGSKIDVQAASQRYYVGGEEKIAPGPSFIFEGSYYIDANILAAASIHMAYSAEGLILSLEEDSGKTSAEGVSSMREDDFVELTAYQEKLGHMTLVNKEHRIDREATGKDLVVLNDVYPGYHYTKDQMQLEATAAQHMALMLDDMDDLEKTYVVSTYRSYDYQTGLLDRKTKQYQTNYGYDEGKAREEAARIVALPGSSEHQTGLAIDFSSQTLVSQGKYLESEFLDSQAGSWLKDKAHRYGFILRYLEEAEDITQIRPEAWHYRYVGQPHASLIYEENIVLETYIAQLKDKQSLAADLEDGGKSWVLYIDKDLAPKVQIDEKSVEASFSNEGGYILTLWP